ncbi:MAG: type I-E CRISPR-associated protein Cse2/CasB [Pseudoclavibacter sp.]|nr:type I-E CRISPR-associated protein Cse2/CasB [Pseudoclavibacter sp.]
MTGTYYSQNYRNAVKSHTQRVITVLQRDFLDVKGKRPGTQSQARARLARLRNAVSSPLPSDPEVFATIFNELPEELEVRHGEPSEAELAIHAAVCLYAIHQQSRIEQEMHLKSDKRERHNLGYGISRLSKIAPGEDQDKPIVRRFNAIITADGFAEIRHHLRGIVQLLRSGRDGKPVPLNYALLAADLYELQFPARRDGVRLRWSRDALRVRREQEQETGTDEQAESDGAVLEDA